ncbi:efflux RND transporter permease subunit [Eilatimonas milleporae]|uniref:Multidrug efflux pump subunit AcrB n=1 Tax=Eilatimonas milleporae TaxID=911205 RepID=A0A3M0BYB0_9PROT|nr:efflux RND transporter permease subunit [Eilatimonas milleporae]RMB02012.1 multidrug efflux pump subunit AcrB [Eilatimonas milleporae]
MQSSSQIHKDASRTTIASLFFRNRHLLVLTILVILVSGLSAIVSLPRLEDPRIVNRNPLIITPMPGASAERVETLVTEVLEEALQEVDAIKDVESTSSAGVSVIVVELEDAVTAAQNAAIFSEIRDKISEARPSLPAGALEPQIDDKRDPAAYTLIAGVSWRGEAEPALGVLNRRAEDLAERLRNVPGTELVRIYGEPDEEITVTVNAEDLAELGLTAGDVAWATALADTKTPAGVLRGDRADVSIEVAGELSSLSRIGHVPIAVGGDQQSVRIADIAHIERAYRDPPTEIGLVNGKRTVFVAARIGFGRRVDLWAKDANAVLAEAAAETGGPVIIEPVFEQERYTTGQLAELSGNLIAGALVVVAVVFVMMGWRLALIVGAALPLTVAMVLFGLQVSGNAIHQMSIFGLIIALGLLIDNAIVMADEVAKNKAAGKTPLQAVEAAVGHLFTPLFASTLTTVLAFAPIFLLPGSVGDFVGSIGQMVILALISSFIIAMTVTAALAGLFAEPSAPDAPKRFWRDGLTSKRFGRFYRGALLSGLKRPWAAIVVAIAAPVAGFAVAPTLGNQFFPPVDRDMFEVEVWAPSDASLSRTADLAYAIEAEIKAFAETEQMTWLVGGSFPSVYYNLMMDKDAAAHYAHGIVTAPSNEAAKAMIAPLQAHLDERFPDAQIVLGQFGQGPPLTADIEYRVFGPSIAELQRIGERLRTGLQNYSGVLHTQMTMEGGHPKLWFNADEDETQLAGLRLTEVASQLQSNLEGATGGFIIEQLEQLPVRVRYENTVRADVSDIASTPLVTQNSDRWVSAAALGDFTLRPELRSITRFDRERTNIIRGYTANDALPIDITRDVLEQLEAEGFILPAGYRIELGGAVEQDAAAKGNLLTYAPVLLTLTIATLVLVFRSAAIAGLLGAVAFLSLGLGMLSTFAIGFPISFNTILGTLGLIGLAFNNAIVVLAAIRANPVAKAGDPEAVTEAILGTSRHIVSTTLTTIGGFLPLLLFVGGDFWPSLSIVLAGGVGGSMILALIFVPAVYRLVVKPAGKPKAAASKTVSPSSHFAFGSAR